MHPKLGINESKWEEVRDYVQKNRAIRKDMKITILKIVWNQLTSGFGTYVAKQTCERCFQKINDREIEPEVEYNYNVTDYADYEKWHECIHCGCKVYC